MKEFDRTILKCEYAQVTACPICEAKGVISNMHRQGNKFHCDTCGTEILLDKLEVNQK